MTDSRIATCGRSSSKTMTCSRSPDKSVSCSVSEAGCWQASSKHTAQSSSTRPFNGIELTFFARREAKKKIATVTKCHFT